MVPVLSKKVKKKFLPNTPDSVLVGYDENLLIHGNKLFNLLEDDISNSSSFYYDEQKYFSTLSTYKTFENPEIENYFQKNIVEYTGIDKRTLRKFNIVRPCLPLQNIHTQVCNLENIETMGTLDKNYFNKFYRIKNNERTQNKWYTTCTWHRDFPELNGFSHMYNIIVYLNDLTENQGGVQIAKNEYTGNIHVNDIQYNEIYGPAGTFISFNAWHLHRATIPAHSYRKVMHIQFSF